MEEEAKKKADAAKRAEEEKKRLEEEAKKKPNKPVVTPTVPTPTTQTDFNSTKTVNGKEWRYIDMGNISSKTLGALKMVNYTYAPESLSNLPPQCKSP